MKLRLCSQQDRTTVQFAVKYGLGTTSPPLAMLAGFRQQGQHAIAANMGSQLPKRTGTDRQTDNGRKKKTLQVEVCVCETTQRRPGPQYPAPAYFLGVLSGQSGSSPWNQRTIQACEPCSRRPTSLPPSLWAVGKFLKRKEACRAKRERGLSSAEMRGICGSTYGRFTASTTYHSMQRRACRAEAAVLYKWPH